MTKNRDVVRALREGRDAHEVKALAKAAARSSFRMTMIVVGVACGVGALAVGAVWVLSRVW